MCFKSGRALVALLAALGLGALLGCGLNLGDEKQGTGSVKLDGSGFHCMTHIRENLEAYFGAELSAKQTGDFYDCLKTSFEQFQKYTRGADRESYTPEELQRFIETNFLKPRTIGAGLMTEAMNLKVALLGGDTKKITRDEFKKLNGVLDTLKSASVQMQPYMRVINPDVGMKVFTDYKERLVHAREAGEAAMRVAQFVGRDLGEKAQNYPLQHAQGFLVELTRFLYGDESDSVLRSRKWADMFGEFKHLASGGERATIEPQDWGSFLQSGFGWYVVYLRYNYQSTGGSLLYGSGLEDFVDNIGRGLHLAQLSLNRQDQKVLTYDDLEQLVYRMKALDLMPGKFSAFGVTQTLRPLFDRILGDVETKPKKRKSKGLTQYALAQGAVEFYRWSEIQFFLDRKFTPALRPQTVDLSNQVFGFPLVGAQKGSGHQLDFKVQSQQQVTGTMVLKELDRIRTSVRPFFRQGANKALLAPREELVEHDVYHGFYNLSVMNIVRGLVRLLVRGYAEDLPRALDMVGLTDDEMDFFFKDMKDLGRDLHFMDPRNIPVLGHRSFMEGNVFTFIGNGIQKPDASDPQRHLLVFEEGLELVSLVYSGGNLNDDLYILGLETCPTGSIDVFGRPKVDRGCFREKAVAELSGYMAHLPKMKAFWDGLSLEGKAEAFGILENIAVRPIQDEVEYRETEKLLDGTTPVKHCEAPYFMGFRKEAKRKYMECLENNRKRIPLLVKMMEELREKGMSPVDCDWVTDKEVSKNYCPWVESGEIGTMAVILHYVETIMTRFDTDGNGLLETAEAWEAYPVFRGLIGKLAKNAGHDLDDSGMQDVYGYILSNGGKVPGGSLGVAWSKTLSGFSWSMALNRMDMIRIFGTITGEGHVCRVRLERNLTGIRPRPCGSRSWLRTTAWMT